MCLRNRFFEYHIYVQLLQFFVVVAKHTFLGEQVNKEFFKRKKTVFFYPCLKMSEYSVGNLKSFHLTSHEVFVIQKLVLPSLYIYFYLQIIIKNLIRALPG